MPNVRDLPAESVHLDYGLFIIDKRLHEFLKEAAGLALPSCSPLQLTSAGNRLLQAERDYGVEKERRTADELNEQLNKDQRKIYDEILLTIANDPQNARFFIQGPGGTGQWVPEFSLTFGFWEDGPCALCWG
jgi:hypothetical protein